MSGSHPIDVDDYDIENPELFVTSDLEIVGDGSSTEAIIKEEETADTNATVEDLNDIANDTESHEPASDLVQIKQEPNDGFEMVPSSEWLEARNLAINYNLEEDGLEVDTSPPHVRGPTTNDHVTFDASDKYDAPSDTGNAEQESPRVQPPAPAESSLFINSPIPRHSTPPRHSPPTLSRTDEDVIAPTSPIMDDLQKLHERQLLASARRQKEKDPPSGDSDIEFFDAMPFAGTLEARPGFDPDARSPGSEEDREWLQKKRKFQKLTDDGEVTLQDLYDMDRADHQHEVRRKVRDRNISDNDLDDQNDSAGGLFDDIFEEEAELSLQVPQQSHKRTKAVQRIKGKTAGIVLQRLKKVTRKEAQVAREKSKKKNKLPKKRSRKATKAEASRHDRANADLAEFMKSLQSDAIADANDLDDQGIPEVPRLNLEGESRSRKKALQNMMFDVADANLKRKRQDKKDLENACRRFPGRMVRPAHSGRWEVRGMNSHLSHHQLLGSAWMLEREHGSREEGGILADEMGFGKTVQALATMIGNRPSHSKPRATLIVCPAGLVRQWREEVRKHVTSYEPMYVHQSPNRVDSDGGEAHIEQAFCMITSYDEVRLSLKSSECPNELVTDDQIVEWYKTHGQVGILHRVNWHRIVLDECTAIKNYQSSTARACYMLEGKHRWLMSGTPLVNGVHEMYSYMCFLRMGCAGSSEQFTSNFIDSDDGMERMQKVIKTIMLRRTHKSLLFDRRIIKLPKCFRSTARIPFTTLEEGIYFVCQRRFSYFVNETARRYFEERQSSQEGEESYTLDSRTRNGYVQNVLCLILRLRQIATHPLLAGETIKKLLTPEDRKEISGILSSTSGGGVPYGLVKELREALVEADAEVRREAREDLVYDAHSNRTGSRFGERQIAGSRFLKIIDNLQDVEEEEEVEPVCVFCGTVPQIPEVLPMETSCGHLYCQPCLLEHQLAEAHLGRPRAKCFDCGEVYEKAERARRPWVSPSERKRRMDRRKENQDISWIFDQAQPLTPSAKLMAVKAQVTTWLDQDSNSKIIIYTQFHAVILCLERLCRDEGWGFLSYHGKKSLGARNSSITEFAENPDKKIFIVSLKAGGVGLNLTCANKIISLDLWWNAALESQAFCRIFRIGQERQTSVVRIAVKGSIDELLIQMQERKSASIDKALDDDDSIHRHTFEELMWLFGDVKRDENSVPYVQPARPPGLVWRGGERGQGLNFALP